MSKPRWIDSGVFKTLRTATRQRTLAVIVGPAHSAAEIGSKAQAGEALGDTDRESLKDDPRGKSKAMPGLTALYKLKQPGFATSIVSDAPLASQPEDLETVRTFGPNSKALPLNRACDFHRTRLGRDDNHLI